MRTTQPFLKFNPHASLLVTVLMLVLHWTSNVSAARSFCNDWVYDYWDSNKGEDFLLESGSTGQIDASGAWASVARDGVVVWFGYVNNSGCTRRACAQHPERLPPARSMKLSVLVPSAWTSRPRFSSPRNS